MYIGQGRFGHEAIINIIANSKLFSEHVRKSTEEGGKVKLLNM